MIDPVPSPTHRVDPRQGRPLGRDKGPVLGPFRALLDPLLEQVNLGRGQLLAALGRRHALFGVGASDTPNQFAFRHCAGHDGKSATPQLSEGAVAGVQRERGGRCRPTAGHRGGHLAGHHAVAGRAHRHRDGDVLACGDRRGHRGRMPRWPIDVVIVFVAPALSPAIVADLVVAKRGY